MIDKHEAGKIAAVIGKDRSSLPEGWAEGYDAKQADMAAKRAAQAAEMVRYEAMRAQGMSDAEIERIW